ncbi:hypothetical protein QE370_002894 [Aeromicrobium sp. SORGH_AS981]|uniref:hypothetical protein n=1 Tax=Aeromicrobium sp. SORGH_AS_0981 TaxID=3041802 RepID=UPI0028674C3A|nr:hypothetical protein [Aeromicrobium sp. SORGH_AS_0981]MDR6119710.1 hypothetical protein [Aeromicrobium sp. SORGH_AS_0981]
MSDEPVGGVKLFLDGKDLLLDGNRADIDRVLEDLSLDRRAARKGVAVGKTEAGAVVAAGATAATLAATSRELYELTPQAKELIESFGWAENAAGSLSGVVRNDRSSIAGHLSFDKAVLGANQAVALQTAAVAIALRSAIAEVEKAVAEVDGKIEDLQRRARAVEIGEVVALYRELERIVEQTQKRGRLLGADWDSVDSVRRDLAAALEKLRTYVTSTVRATSPDDDLSDRVKAVEQIASAQSVAGSLQLIAVAEHALHLWYYIYVERIRTTDPDELLEAVETARGVLEQHRELDEQLVALVLDRITELGDVRPLEIHHRLSIRRLDRAMVEARDSVETFAERSRTPLPQLTERSATRPGLPEARAEVRARAKEARGVGADVSRAAARSVRSQAARRIDSKRHRKEQDEGGASRGDPLS